MRSLLLLLVCSLLATSPAVQGESLEQRYLAELRERGMYRLAELYCRDRLADTKLTDREQIELAVEWSLVAVAQAYDSAPVAREPHWRTADRVLEPWTKVPDRAYRLLAQMQTGLNGLSRAELTTLEQVGAIDDDTMVELQSDLRNSIGLLREVLDEVQLRRQEIAMRRTRGEPELTDRELAGLERSLQLSLAKAFHTQARTYAEGSADRVNSLQQAAESLGSLSTAEPVDELTWQARIAWLEAMAELAQGEQAMAAIASWRESGEVPTDQQAALVAAQTRLLIATNQTQQATAWLQASQFAVGRSPVVDLARLELLLSTTSGQQQPLEALLATIRRQHAPRYVRQAEAMVGQRFAAASDANSAIARVHAAEHLYRAGQLASAIAAYDQAAEQFRNDRDRNQAFAAERAAAAIVQKQGEYADAAARFRRLALGSFDREDSAIDHREALLCLAEMARRADSTTRDELLSVYVDACREHLRHWPEGTTMPEVRWWLAKALVARDQWQAVIELLAPVEVGMPYAEDCYALLAVAYRGRINELTESTERTKLASQAVQRLLPAIVGTGDSVGWPTEWSDAQRTCALELARITLDSGNTSYAEKVLQAAMQRDPPPGFVDQATPVLAMAYVLGGKTKEAIDLLRNSAGGGVGAGSLEGLAEQLTDQLNVYARATPPRTTERAAMGQLLLAVIDVAGTNTSTWKLSADRYRAAAYAAIENVQEARKLYLAVIAKYPNDGELREEYARVLGSSSTAADREAALAVWSQLERGSTRGGERWHRARQARIDLLNKLGRRQEAEKLEKLTRLLSGGK
ncbi:hypothetical protein [Aeoliella mucimassa]|uniref:Tetratricopeptide repeat protein n=1 Tax=Aeoliella mucimassa TaxID=2527972 RepID=A0A518AHY2_9BACT|nr:hypothetical protein [Aeoliella mucimassa]QDU54337.1 hypothetical protein Pan181_05180 [Aeoliella mucimassa]